MLERVINYIAKRKVYSDDKKLYYTCKKCYLVLNVITLCYVLYKSSVVIAITGVLIMFVCGIAIIEFYDLVADRVYSLTKEYEEMDTICKNELREIMEIIQKIDEQE